MGISLSLIGELVNHDTKAVSHFLFLSNDLCPFGEIKRPINFKYSFKKIEAPYETYIGTHFSVRYYIRVSIIRKMFNTVKNYEKDFYIENIAKEPLIVGNCRMEIGVSEKLHMEYELFQNKLHLNDVITGKLYFISVSSNIKSIEVQLIKKEKIGSGDSMTYENFIMGRTEACDGQPYKGDVIPFRMYLTGRGLTPSIKRAEGFGVNYYVKILVILENDKLLYKNQEVILWRKTFG